KCQKEFLEFIDVETIDKKEGGRQIVADSYDEVVYRNVSDKIGAWTEVHLLEKKTPYIYKIEDENIMKYSFDENCQKISENSQWPSLLEKVLSRVQPEDFKNDNLRSFVGTQKKGVIYNWSPKFSYSVFLLPKIEKLAKELGYEFIAVVDPRSSNKEIAASLKIIAKKLPANSRLLASENKINRNVSIDLFMRSGFNHYPVTFVSNKGKIHPHFITGIMTDEGFKDLFKIYTEELK
ncbi:MAG: hypothetical protein Q7U04_18100, partial [Bacteriovorax sp.]|nr:hypothetical protein [Bacteriovorax sp.]